MPTNTLLTIGMITRELLDSFDNMRVFTKYIENKYSSEFATPGAKIGPTLKIRLPAQVRTTSGPNLSVQDYIEQSTPLTIDQQEHVDVAFSSFEMTLSLDDWRRRIGGPRASCSGNTVDVYGLGCTGWCPTPLSPRHRLRQVVCVSQGRGAAGRQRHPAGRGVARLSQPVGTGSSGEREQGLVRSRVRRLRGSMSVA